MLKAIDLCKTYKPKHGVAVKALNNISLTFPDTGMVFLLGKSGSGKSTLLNVLGGLDKYDSGDIIVKGTSTKHFKQSHFDSYRNTYIGFIFQEYNILDEFTVGANIALAIELQGKKAENEEINRILKEVDLEGYGNRRPNELSGGQKQRVAIARALVKNPEIIFADEPTGALDSATGKQVFDTLKKLSKDKLVVIVSHDREFAEGYADRIIELADGVVISDVELSGGLMNSVAEENLVFAENSINITAGYQLTEEDRQMINRFLRSSETNVEIKKLASSGKSFINTNTESIVSKKNSGFSLIKSRLPLKSAFVIGSGALKHKKVRLVFTVLLSLVAFTLFGLANTFSSYDHVRACTDSIIDTHITYATIQRQDRRERDGAIYESVDDEHRYYWKNVMLSEADISSLSEKLGISLSGMNSSSCVFSGNVGKKSTLDGFDIYSEQFTRFYEATAENLSQMHYKIIAGRLPEQGKNELAITKYICETFIKCGYIEKNGDKTTISAYVDMVGKVLTLNGKDFTVSGVVDTNFNLDRYLPLYGEQDNDNMASVIRDYALYQEFQNEIKYSLCNAAIVPKGFIEQYGSIIGNGKTVYAEINDRNTYSYGGFDRILPFDSVDKTRITWLDGEKETLGSNEIVIETANMYLNYSKDKNVGSTYDFLKKNRSFNIGIYTNEDMYITKEVVIVGYVDSKTDSYYSSSMYCGDDMINTVFGKSEDAVYDYAVGAMPSSKRDIKKLVELTCDESGTEKYKLNNSVTFELEIFSDSAKEISYIFVSVGVFFAIFAMILLSTFIASSVAYKKQEIGILRAIGSRSKDVFLIFFSESFVIAIANFLLSSVATALIVNAINRYIRHDVGLVLTILHFGIKQLVLILLISLAVAAVASFLPVKRIASKKPIDAIRNR